MGLFVFAIVLVVRFVSQCFQRCDIVNFTHNIMQNTFVFICFLSCFFRLVAQPCPTDTLFITGSPMYATDTETPSDPPPPCYSQGCEADFCHVWQLPPNFVGHLELFSTSPTAFPISVLIGENCHLIRFQACKSIGGDPNIGTWDTLLIFPANCQVAVCDGVNPITILIKPVAAHDTLPQPFLDLDTLCGALGVPEMVQSRYTYQALDLLGGTKGEPQDDPPVGLSIRSDGVKVWRDDE